ncbi:uncharacterized protein FA14DRAFT_188740 [Meira miltonrushii]|uniref:Uncharacterized protein n=1 Tax=Meira miltonrushii TaxID=1280837 RepID=A0A316VF70_9BASI|nr:uncharacterized protein FA14DRAFT_188740 [Meira miltonrushii]PWN34661.1 hypothetical protein FA14DRAFT_188740 [Meira miltonrushii]
MLPQSSLRRLALAIAVSSLVIGQVVVDARPVEQYGDAPPFTRSIAMSLRGDPSDSDQDTPRNTSLLSVDIGANLNLRSIKTLKQESVVVETFEERGLVGDSLKGLMGPLSIIPGFVQVSDILFGDGKQDTGLFGKLGGLLLTVEPQNNNSTDAGASSDGNKNATAVNQAAQASMRYALSASKKQQTQVFLVPVHQANAEPDSSSDGSNTTSTGKNDTMTVKMMMHMLNAQGAPIVMCASYGSSPPTDLGVNECSGETPSDANTTEGSQLFTYKPSTGALTPMFANAKDDGMGVGQGVTADAGAGNATVNATSSASKQQEMRMHFVMATTPDAPTAEAQEGASSSSSAPAAASTASIPAPTTPASADGHQMQRIVLGREFVQKAKMSQLNVNGQDDSSSAGCEDDASSTDSSASSSDSSSSSADAASQESR